MKLFAKYDRRCGHCTDAVHQGFSPQVEVDEGGHEADLGAAQPEPDILRPVLHEQRHAVPVLEPGPEQEVRQLVAVLVQLRFIYRSRGLFRTILPA